LYCFPVLGMESRASHMVDRRCTTEPHPMHPPLPDAILKALIAGWVPVVEILGKFEIISHLHKSFLEHIFNWRN
jgi:hypothetical protein